MPNFDAQDLEDLIEISTTRFVETYQLPRDDVEAILRLSAEEIETRNNSNIERLYSSLIGNPYFVSSFQGYAKHDGINPASESTLRKNNGGEIEKIYPVIFNQVHSMVNGIFSKDLSDRQRGRGQFYVWLEDLGQGQGILKSYGDAHFDKFGRTNPHFFQVEGEYDQLTKVADSFIADPANIAKFTRTVFSWENVPRSRQPDLTEAMTELYVQTTEKGITTVRV